MSHTPALPSAPAGRTLGFLRRHARAAWYVTALTIVLAAYLSTLLTAVNGRPDPYTTDVGEIQNALPRWGLIHYSGYPFYLVTGSPFVSALQAAGIPPAAGSSFLSVVWGLVAVWLAMRLAEELGAPPWAAALGALAMAFSASVWVYASMAEVNTLTLTFVLATMLAAMRFGRSGRRRDLLLLALLFSQSIMHQRATVVAAPALLVLVWPQLRALWRGIVPAAGICLAAPAIYLYLPLRVWTGATWIFGSPGTWEGFWKILLDTKVDRTVRVPIDWAHWSDRASVVAQLIVNDLPWPLLLIGLGGLLALVLIGKRRESLAFTLAWLPYLPLTFIIWEGRVSDAELAVKLPIMAFAGIGLAALLGVLWSRSRAAGAAGALALLAALCAWAWVTRPAVTAITHDTSGEAAIAVAERIPSSGGRPPVLMALWGHDYWALAYAQAYRGQLRGLQLVDHNADVKSIAQAGDRLLVLSQTFYVLPLDWWEHRLGPLYLSTAAPGVVEVSTRPVLAPGDVPAETSLDLANGMAIRAAQLAWSTPQQLHLTVFWEARRVPAEDYHVAVHLTAQEPPRSGADILAQADATHPVEDWYPTSRWRAGEIVRDDYLIDVPAGSQPVAVDVGMYSVDPEGKFLNSPKLSLPIPAR